jgi:hypothetical protein
MRKMLRSDFEKLGDDGIEHDGEAYVLTHDERVLEEVCLVDGCQSCGTTENVTRSWIPLPGSKADAPPYCESCYAKACEETARALAEGVVF